jgi:hypothetical protein
LAAGNKRAEPSLFQSAWNQKITNFGIKKFEMLDIFLGLPGESRS